DRDRGALPDSSTDLEAVQARQADVEQHQVRPLVLAALHCLDPVCRRDDVVPVPAQRVGRYVEQIGVIVGYKDLHVFLPMGLMLARAGAASGSVTQNEAPPPGVP